ADDRKHPVILMAGDLELVGLMQPKPPREIAFLFVRQVVQTFPKRNDNAECLGAVFLSLKVDWN
ncbi:hypothetical protein, partial [Chromobacterium violaceum]